MSTLWHNLSYPYLWHNLTYNLTHDPYLLLGAFLYIAFVVIAAVTVLRFHRGSVAGFAHQAEQATEYGNEQLQYLKQKRLKLFKHNSGGMLPKEWWALQMAATAGRIKLANEGTTRWSGPEIETPRLLVESAGTSRAPSLSEIQKDKQPESAPLTASNKLVGMAGTVRRGRKSAGLTRTSSSGISLHLKRRQRPAPDTLKRRAAHRIARRARELTSTELSMVPALSDTAGKSEANLHPLLSSAPWPSARKITYEHWSRYGLRGSARVQGSPLRVLADVSETEEPPADGLASITRPECSMEDAMRPNCLSKVGNIEDERRRCLTDRHHDAYAYTPSAARRLEPTTAPKERFRASMVSM